MRNTNLRFTHHALDTMARRDVSTQEVLLTILQYEKRYHSPTHRGTPTPHVYVYQRGPLSVVVDESCEYLLVVTVLLNAKHRWTDEEVASRPREQVS